MVWEAQVDLWKNVTLHPAQKSRKTLLTPQLSTPSSPILSILNTPYFYQKMNSSQCHKKSVFTVCISKVACRECPSLSAGVERVVCSGIFPISKPHRASPPSAASSSVFRPSGTRLLYPELFSPLPSSEVPQKLPPPMSPWHNCPAPRSAHLNISPGCSVPSTAGLHTGPAYPLLSAARSFLSFFIDSSGGKLSLWQSGAWNLFHSLTFCQQLPPQSVAGLLKQSQTPESRSWVWARNSQRTVSLLTSLLGDFVARVSLRTTAFIYHDKVSL